MNGKARLAAVVLGTVVALFLGGCGGGDSAPIWDWDDFKVDVLIENKLPDRVMIYVEDGSEDGGGREFVGALDPGGRRYFQLDYEFDDGRLYAYSDAEGLTDSSHVEDGLHWHVK